MSPGLSPGTKGAFLIINLAGAILLVCIVVLGCGLALWTATRPGGATDDPAASAENLVRDALATQLEATRARRDLIDRYLSSATPYPEPPEASIVALSVDAPQDDPQADTLRAAVNARVEFHTRQGHSHNARCEFAFDLSWADGRWYIAPDDLATVADWLDLCTPETKSTG
jgi:hypothetical protein